MSCDCIEKIRKVLTEEHNGVVPELEINVAFIDGEPVEFIPGLKYKIRVKPDYRLKKDIAKGDLTWKGARANKIVPFIYCPFCGKELDPDLQK